MNISLAAEPIFHIGSLPITNTVIMAMLVVCVLSLLLIVFRSSNAVETLVEGMLSFADGITGNRKKTIEFFPFVATLFVFILGSNFLELVPGLGSIGVYEELHGKTVLVPFIRSASADLNFTLALAILSVLAAQWYGMKHGGYFRYWTKFFVPPWKQPYVIGTFVGILEFISEFAKVISFSFRLFGNIFAGEVLLLIIGYLLPYIAPLPFLFLEIFVGLVQALVFSVLTLVFINLATESHESSPAHS